MARQPNTQDVSVDEIIASIRRIVADDDQGNTSSAADSVAAASPSVGDAAGFRPRSATAIEDILNFPPVNPGILGARANRNSRTSPRARMQTGNHPSKQSGSRKRLPRPWWATAMQKRSRGGRAKPRRRRVRATEQALLSRTAAGAVDREFEALSQIVSGSWNARLDAMAREMMRPMLRVWLDRHLPKLVRQLVREEIARISGTSR